MYCHFPLFLGAWALRFTISACHVAALPEVLHHLQSGGLSPNLQEMIWARGRHLTGLVGALCLEDPETLQPPWRTNKAFWGACWVRWALCRSAGLRPHPLICSMCEEDQLRNAGRRILEVRLWKLLPWNFIPQSEPMTRT